MWFFYVNSVWSTRLRILFHCSQHSGPPAIPHPDVSDIHLNETPDHAAPVAKVQTVFLWSCHTPCLPDLD